MGARGETIVCPPRRKQSDLTCDFSLPVWIFLTPLNVTYSRLGLHRMREIESDGETANGQAGAQTSTTWAPWKAGPLGAREQGGGATGPREQGATGPHGVRLRHKGLFARSTRIQFPWLQKPCGEHPPPEEKNIFAKGREKSKEGGKDEKNARLERVFSHHLERATWNGWSRFPQ